MDVIEVLAESREWMNGKTEGVQEGTEYSILTAEISKATFGLTPTEYKEVKQLKRENLRDHMTVFSLHRQHHHRTRRQRRFKAVAR